MLRLTMKMGEQEGAHTKNQMLSILNISNALIANAKRTAGGGRGPFNLGICVHSSKFYTTTFMCNVYGPVSLLKCPRTPLN